MAAGAAEPSTYNRPDDVSTTDIPDLPERIWICGFMGAGKSTLGRLLAARLGVSFTDLDRHLAERAGMSIPEIFEKEGEEGFRERERALVLELAREGSGVIALGGGSLQDRSLADHLRKHGLLIFIDTPFSVIFERIREDTGRPLADKAGEPGGDHDEGRGRLKALLERRRPLYEQAELSLHPEQTAPQRPEQLVDQLMDKIRLHVSHL